MGFIISLSNEGDYFQLLSKNSWKATFDIKKATIFNNAVEALETVNDLEVFIFWPNLKVQINK